MRATLTASVLGVLFMIACDDDSDGVDEDCTTLSCRCAATPQDPDCTNDVDPCVGIACENGGTCAANDGVALCACLGGYVGARCEIDVDECAEDPCGEGGTCIDGVNGYTCSCHPGYTGTLCEEAPGPCGDLDEPCPLGFACAASGTCVSATTGEIWIAGGNFWMGCNPVLDSDCDPVESPQREVILSAHAIDRSPVTVAAYDACVKSQACSEPRSDDWDEPARFDHPVTFVTWSQASAYCAWPGKPAGAQRLCTEAEWERASRGGCETHRRNCKSRMRKYPWDGDGVPPVEPNAELANYRGEIGGTTPVGAYSPGGDSPYGLQDVAGNVWEWVEDWWNDYADADAVDPVGMLLPGHIPYRIIRGGDFNSARNRVRSSGRAASEPDDATGNVGLRCCRAFP